MASTRTRTVAALAALDVARQVARAWSAREQARREQLGIGALLQERARDAARDLRDRLPHREHHPVRDRMRTVLPIMGIVAAASVLVGVVAHAVARREEGRPIDETATDSRVMHAVQASSKAIDAGVSKVIEGSTAAAAGTASAVAAGSAAVRGAVTETAKEAVQDRVVAPAKRKAITFGTLGLLGLTLWVIVIAAAVQLLIGWLG